MITIDESQYGQMIVKLLTEMGNVRDSRPRRKNVARTACAGFCAGPNRFSAPQPPNPPRAAGGAIDPEGRKP